MQYVWVRGGQGNRRKSQRKEREKNRHDGRQNSIFACRRLINYLRNFSDTDELTPSYTQPPPLSRCRTKIDFIFTLCIRKITNTSCIICHAREHKFD